MHGLGQLDGDRPPADHGDRRRHLLQVEDRLVGQEAGVGQAVDGRRRRATARAQQNEAALQLPVPHRHRVGVDEAPLTLHHLDAERLEATRVVVSSGDVVLHGPDALPDRRSVDFGLDRRKPPAAGGAHHLGRLG